MNWVAEGTPRTPRAVVAAVVLVSLLSARQALAGEKRARLVVDVKVSGSYSVAGTGSEKEAGEFRNAYHLVTLVKSDGEPSPVNTKDPHYGEQMMAKAAAVQQRVAEAQGRAPSAKKMTPEEMQKILRQKQEACHGDQGCLMQVAVEATQMMNNVDFGSPPGAPSAAAAPVDLDAEEEPRFLSYFGFDGCGAEMRVSADSKVSGQYDDVQGPVPYSSALKGESAGDPDQLRLICNSTNLIVDVKTGTMFTDGLSAPVAHGTEHVTDRGRSTESEASLWKAPGWDWVSEQLRQAPRTGQRSTTLKLTQMPGAARIPGKLTGQAHLEVSWKLEDQPG